MFVSLAVYFSRNFMKALPYPYNLVAISLRSKATFMSNLGSRSRRSLLYFVSCRPQTAVEAARDICAKLCEFECLKNYLLSS